MGRKSKVQTAVEDFEVQFENLVQDYLDDIDVDKAEEYFRSGNLYEAAYDVLNIEDEDSDEEDEDGETE